MKHVPGLSVLLLLFVGAGFVASDTGPRADAAGPALSFVQGYVQHPVQDAHLGYYEEHLARLALADVNCR